MSPKRGGGALSDPYTRLVGFFFLLSVSASSYLFIDAKLKAEVLPGVISDKRLAPAKRGISTDWLCTVTTSNNVQFETPCDAGTMLGTTTNVCRRTRVWSGIATHGVGSC